MFKIASICFAGFMVVVTGSDYLTSIGFLKKQTAAQKELSAVYELYQTKTPEEIDKVTHRAAKTCLTQKAGGALPEDYVLIWSELFKAAYSTYAANAKKQIDASKAAEGKEEAIFATSKKINAFETKLRNESRQTRARVALVGAAISEGKDYWPHKCLVSEMARQN